MGTYLGVRAVRGAGEKLCSNFSSQQPRIPAGKRLIGIPNNGVFEIAADLTLSSEYAALYDSYSQGYWLGCDLYLLDESKVAQCPDEGRNYIV